MIWPGNVSFMQSKENWIPHNMILGFLLRDKPKRAFSRVLWYYFHMNELPYAAMGVWVLWCWAYEPTVRNLLKYLIQYPT